MYSRALVPGFLLAYASLVFASQPTDAAITLHCSGKSWPPHFHPNEIPTDALVRINGEGTYIEIAAVGSGQSPSKPRMVSSAEGVGSIKLQSAAAGQPPLEAWFNLNKYSGELIVSPPSGSGGKVLFMGNCRPASPLF